MAIIILAIILFEVYIIGTSKDKQITNANIRSAKANNFMCYQRKNGIKTETRLTSNNQKVYVILDNVYNTRGEKLFNIDDLFIQRRIEYCVPRCESKGYDFIPLIMPRKYMHEEWVKHGLLSPRYIDLRTGEIFELKYLNKKWTIWPLKWNGSFHEPISNGKGGIVFRTAQRDFPQDINEYMWRLQNESREKCRISIGV